MLLARDALFKGFTTFINGLGSDAAPFLEGSATNPDAPFPANTRLTAPQDIIDQFETNAPVALGAVPAGPKVQPGNNVVAYYAITAVSASGESMASNIVEGATGTTQTELLVTWRRYPYAKSYNIYWSKSANLSQAQCIANVAALSYVDSSPGSHSGSVTAPPINNYKYSRLNSYLTETVEVFFNYYRPGGANPHKNVFVLDDEATKTKWTGYTQDVVDSGQTYAVLFLTGGPGQWGNQFAGKTLSVYQPLFRDNTGIQSYPPAPSWLLLNNRLESPSSMVFGADGVFGDVVGQPSTLDPGDAKNVYNNIVSALNRGITPRNVNDGWIVLPPNYWASSPLLESATPQSGGSLAPGIYRYAIAAVAINTAAIKGTVTGASCKPGLIEITSPNHGLQPDDRVTIAGVNGIPQANGGFQVTIVDANTFSISVAGTGSYSGGGSWDLVSETTPSNVIQVTVKSPHSAVLLTWKAINKPGSAAGAMTAGGFNIYRSQQVNGAWTDLKGSAPSRSPTPAPSRRRNTPTAARHRRYFSRRSSTTPTLRNRISTQPISRGSMSASTASAMDFPMPTRTANRPTFK